MVTPAGPPPSWRVSRPDMTWILSFIALGALWAAGWLPNIWAAIGIFGFVGLYVAIRRATVSDKAAMITFLVAAMLFIVLPLLWGKYYALQSAIERQQVIKDILTAEKTETPGSLGIAAYYAYCRRIEDVAGQYMADRLKMIADDLQKVIEEHPDPKLLSPTHIAERLGTASSKADHTLLVLTAIQELRNECREYIRGYAGTLPVTWPLSTETLLLILASLIVASMVSGFALPAGYKVSTVSVLIAIGLLLLLYQWLKGGFTLPGVPSFILDPASWVKKITAGGWFVLGMLFLVGGIIVMTMARKMSRPTLASLIGILMALSFITLAGYALIAKALDPAVSSHTHGILANLGTLLTNAARAFLEEPSAKEWVVLAVMLGLTGYFLASATTKGKSWFNVLGGLLTWMALMIAILWFAYGGYTKIVGPPEPTWTVLSDNKGKIESIRVEKNRTYAVIKFFGLNGSSWATVYDCNLYDDNVGYGRWNYRNSPKGAELSCIHKGGAIELKQQDCNDPNRPPKSIFLEKR